MLLACSRHLSFQAFRAAKDFIIGTKSSRSRSPTLCVSFFEKNNNVHDRHAKVGHNNNKKYFEV
jgi:hypothetical protein